MILWILSIIIPILNPTLFIQVFISILVNVIYSILIYNAIENNREEFEFSKLILISSILFLIFNLSFFFIPSISVSNIEPGEQIIANLIFTIYASLKYIPFLILQGIALIIFGWYNRSRYTIYLLIAGILITINLTLFYISYLLGRFGLIDLTDTTNIWTIFYFKSSAF